MARSDQKNTDLLLRSKWIDDNSKTGQMVLSLLAPPDAAFPATVRLAYTAITRIPPETELIGAHYIARTANYHELQPLAPLKAGPDGLLWQITIPVLSHKPNHCTDGPSSAFLILPDNSTIDIDCDPLRPENETAEGSDEQADVATKAEPSSQTAPTAPMLAMLPMPNQSSVAAWREAAPSAFALDESLKDVGDRVNALYIRLFGEKPPFGEASSSITLRLATDGGQRAKDDARAGAYRLTFSDKEIVINADDKGIFYALIALAQIWRGAQKEPALFAFPASGTIEDWPSHDWRGMHLDVSRQFYSAETVTAFLDCLAWHRLNRFHWHLTDDEGWRLESKIYPHLTEIGAWRGHGLALLPQHGSGAARYGGFYTQEQVRDILAHAASLQIDVMPEVDVPGHCHAAMMALPELIDPSAMQGNASVQGYVNNALNPGLGATWLFLESIFGELADLFPGACVHIGGDEVPHGAWVGSRGANSWAKAKGLLDTDGKPDSMKMQAAILRFVVNRLEDAGKVPFAWQEAAKGGGVDPEKVTLMAWMNAQSARDLTDQGYRVVMCPGEVYYLDMAQSTNWQEPGLSWAGTSSPADTYQFDAQASLGKNKDLLVGIQGGIWSENLISRARFNHMVFPRLSAIAESAWTLPKHKQWSSFEARQRLMPTLPETIKA
ncbi:hexosaminidase [Cohaesibacter marisflavi]|uniref:beta-N-acetylhexosaminidase n=1 Tax=Cohaesibacter marisflavi TaxID=655353 RepID=A0A1I5BVJ9_9HYPH|nr:family 20 glycosylhydrolase [Cohaesibacter marisflavi]SFN78796.1 hexosaminidase [Cohaesibacter marisflavi]